MRVQAGRSVLRGGAGTAGLVVGLLCVSACREATGPWQNASLDADSTAAIRLTFSSGNDLYPSWSPDGRSVLYAAESFTGLPAGAGLLLTMGRDGGAARLVFPDLQGAGAGGPRRLSASDVAPDGDNVAYLDLVRIGTPSNVITETGCTIPEPALDTAVVRVRRIGETRSILGDIAVGMRLAGPAPDQRTGGLGPFTIRLHPFQRVFLETEALPLRPSWSTDGRLVFSDGLRLLIRQQDGSTRVVPGTADGVTPAWSPDGEWIAFARLERGDSTTQVCDISAGNTVIRQFRVGYSGRRSTIMRIRADGSDPLELTDGDAPAWAADGSSIYFASGGRVFRISRDGGVPEPTLGTDDGYWPAVSPDGGRLAFMRRGPATSWDLWTVPLPR